MQFVHMSEKLQFVTRFDKLKLIGHQTASLPRPDVYTLDPLAEASGN